MKNKQRAKQIAIAFCQQTKCLAENGLFFSELVSVCEQYLSNTSLTKSRRADLIADSFVSRTGLISADGSFYSELKEIVLKY